jgi:hypothetical protein
MTTGSVVPSEGVTVCSSARLVTEASGSSPVVRLSFEGDRLP